MHVFGERDYSLTIYAISMQPVLNWLSGGKGKRVVSVLLRNYDSPDLMPDTPLFSAYKDNDKTYQVKREPGHGAQSQESAQFLKSSPVLTAPRGTATPRLPQGFWF